MSHDPRAKLVCRMLVAVIGVLPLLVHAENEGTKEDRLLGFVITPGIGVRILDLHVTRNADGATGTITSDGSFTGPLYVALDIESPTYLLNEKWGVTVRAHTASFSLHNQRVKSASTQDGQGLQDLGTSVEGHYRYLMPTIFYRTVDSSGDSRIGIGYGYWKAWFSGDIILAPDNAATAAMPKTSISGSTDGKTGLLLFWQTRWAKGLFEFSFSNVRLSGSGYKYELEEINMMLGYHLEF